MDTTKLAYLAGLLDGEGYLGIAGRWQRKYKMWVQISSTNLDVITWVNENFGGAIYTQRRPKPNKDRYTNNFPSTLGIEILQQLLPYLIIKKQQAECLIAYSNLKGLQSVTKAREAFYDKMKELNTKGK